MWVQGYFSCNRGVRKRMKWGQRGKGRKKGKKFQRLAPTQEGGSCWETLAAARVRRRERSWLEGIQKSEAAAERCGVLSGEAEACPWNASAQRECKHCPGLYPWAVRFGVCRRYLTSGRSIAAVRSVRLSRPPGNANPFSLRIFPCLFFFFSVDRLTLNPVFAFDYYFMTRRDEVFKNFSKFKIIFTLAPVKISDNCR